MRTNKPSNGVGRRSSIWSIGMLGTALLAGATSTVAACSSDDPDIVDDKDSGSKILAETGPAEVEQEAGPIDAGSDAADVSSPVDADSGRDPFGDFADSGTECPRVNLIQERPCQNGCAKQARVCLPAEDAGVDDGGAPTLIWQEWGECLSVIENGCNPGQTVGITCGKCGVQIQTCKADCTFAGGACQYEGPCMPGQLERVDNLSCDNGYRERTCGKNCQWGDFGDCIVPP